MPRLAGPALFAGIIALDQVTKWLALRELEQFERLSITPFFNLVLVWNRGVSFGMFAGSGDAGRWLLVALALVITIFLIVWLLRETRLIARLALWSIMAGALGNLVDRVRFGAVVDFLDFHAWGYHWPAFNVADSAIVVGAGLLLLESLVSRNNVRKDREWT